MPANVAPMTLLARFSSCDRSEAQQAITSLPSSLATVSTGMVRLYASHHSGFVVMSLTLHKKHCLEPHCCARVQCYFAMEEVLKAICMQGFL